MIKTIHRKTFKDLDPYAKSSFPNCFGVRFFMRSGHGTGLSASDQLSGQALKPHRFCAPGFSFEVSTIQEFRSCELAPGAHPDSSIPDPFYAIFARYPRVASLGLLVH